MTKGQLDIPDFFILGGERYEPIAVTMATLPAVELVQSSGYNLQNGPTIFVKASEIEDLFKLIDEAGLNTMTM